VLVAQPTKAPALSHPPFGACSPAYQGASTVPQGISAEQLPQGSHTKRVPFLSTCVSVDTEAQEETQATPDLQFACTTDYDFGPSSMPALAAAVASLGGSSFTGSCTCTVVIQKQLFPCVGELFNKDPTCEAVVGSRVQAYPN